MSNCVVGSDECGTPLGVVTEHGVEGHNHLAHHRDDDDLGLFASGGEAIGEFFESGVVSACAQGCRMTTRIQFLGSNCVVRSGGLRLPCSIIAKHSVEGCDHFSHDGDDDDLGFFVGGGEAFVEGFEGGTVTACAEGGHVEDVTDRHPTTIDAAVSLELAAVEVIGCEADEGGDLFAAHLPEFWQQGDEREGQHGADAWHRGQQWRQPSRPGACRGGGYRPPVASGGVC